MSRWTAVILSIAFIDFLGCAESSVAQTVPTQAVAPRIAPGQIPAPAPSASPPSVTGPAFGANDPCTSIGAIVSRPSQTTSVCTVRPGHVLIETGYENLEGTGASTTIQYPQAFVRVGSPVPALEIDLGVPTFGQIRANGMSSSGASDAGGGLKYVFGYTPRFNYGASVFFTTPTGTNGISAGAGTQSVDFNYGYTIDSIWSVAGTFGYNSLATGGEHYTSVVPSLVLTAGLPNATGLFVEGAEFTNATGPASPGRMQLLGGITRGVSARAQLDLEVGGSPRSAAQRYHFIGFGASYYL